MKHSISLCLQRTLQFLIRLSGQTGHSNLELTCYVIVCFHVFSYCINELQAATQTFSELFVTCKREEDDADDRQYPVWDEAYTDHTPHETKSVLIHTIHCRICADDDRQDDGDGRCNQYVCWKHLQQVFSIVF